MLWTLCPYMSLTKAATADDSEQVSHFAKRPSGVSTRVMMCSLWRMKLAKILFVILNAFQDSATVHPVAPRRMLEVGLSGRRHLAVIRAVRCAHLSEPLARCVGDISTVIAHALEHPCALLFDSIGGH